MAIDAMRSLNLLEEAAGVEPLPPAAPLSGYAFVELAVSPDAAAPVERLLIAMGFRHAGQHRTKPVQLWRHGDTRILVNHEGEEHPRVAAIAVESEDPIRSADRAQHLLAPLLPRERGPGEANLSAIAAPDGTSVFFCRTDADGWLTDFLTAGPPGGGISSDVTGIDHVALSQPFDFFDEALLFYRSVLGLELQSADELARPTASYAAARREAPTAASASRSASRWWATTGSRSSTSRSPATTSSRRRRRCATAASRCSRSTTTTTTTCSPAPDSTRRPSSACASSACSTTRPTTANCCTSTRRWSDPACSSRSSSAAARYDGYGAANSPVRVAAQQPVSVIGS